MGTTFINEDQNGQQVMFSVEEMMQNKDDIIKTVIGTTVPQELESVKTFIEYKYGNNAELELRKLKLKVITSHSKSDIISGYTKQIKIGKNKFIKKDFESLFEHWDQIIDLAKQVQEALKGDNDKLIKLDDFKKSLKEKVSDIHQKAAGNNTDFILNTGSFKSIEISYKFWSHLKEEPCVLDISVSPVSSTSKNYTINFGGSISWTRADLYIVYHNFDRITKKYS